MVVNCTEPSPLVSIPWAEHSFDDHKIKDSNPTTGTGREKMAKSYPNPYQKRSSTVQSFPFQLVFLGWRK
jgi:hypothetical protein